MISGLGLGWPLTVKAGPDIFKYDWSQFDAKCSDRRSEVRATLYELPLHEVKQHLDRLIEGKKEIPDW